MTTDLVKRLESGETGRDLDAIIWYTMVEKPGLGEKIDRDMIDRWPAYTTSLDAAVALVERVRPGCDWSVARVGPKHRANIWMPSALRLMPSPHSSAPTPAPALIAALLRSMEGQMEGEGNG